MDHFLVVNGPNLNLLGTRRPDVYGSTTLGELDAACRSWAEELGASCVTFQSNHEGVLIDRLHEARIGVDGIVFNPGAFTHSSYALHDAIEAIEIPTVEVHISNVEEREEWRRQSVVRPACVATIYGRGVEGYRWGLRHLFHRREWPAERVRYGEGADQILDLRRPSGPGPHPLAVMVHGGFWQHMWTRDLMDGIAIHLARRGFIVANLEYRRIGTGGGWPTSVDDVVAGSRAALATPDVDAIRVALIGHSAGAHLAFFAAEQLSADGPPPLVVSMAGVTDLADAMVRDASARFLADTPPDEASPVDRFSGRYPAFLIHGDTDDRVPVEQSRRFAERHEGIPFVELAGTGHFEFLERSDEAWLTVAGIVSDLFL